MARPKDLLRSARADVAKRQRRCAQSKKHVIQAGEKCLLFEENLSKKSYCLPCARSILERAKKQLQDLLVHLS